LKIIPAKKYYKREAERSGKGFEVWCGMRGGESNERGKRYAGKVGDALYPPHEVLRKLPKYLHRLGVMFRLPILDWSEEDVFAYLDGEQNPLYSQGFDRVGCFPCLAGGDKSKLRAFRHDETGRKHYQMVRDLEPIVGRSIWKSKSGKAAFDGPGCMFCSI